MKMTEVVVLSELFISHLRMKDLGHDVEFSFEAFEDTIIIYGSWFQRPVRRPIVY